MKNKNNKFIPQKYTRFIIILHNNNGALISNYVHKVNTEMKYTHFSDINKELSKQLGGTKLPKISISVVPYIDELPKIKDSSIRITILDEIDMAEIVLEASPSHIVLLYTASTKVQSDKLQMFSQTKLVKSVEDIDEVCKEVYFDIYLYHYYNLDNQYSGSRNAQFNELKIKFIKETLNIPLEGQKYVSFYQFAKGDTLETKVASGLKLWEKFILWLKFHTNPQAILFDSKQSEKFSSVDPETIKQYVNNISNPKHLNYVLDDIFLNHPNAKQMSRKKIKRQLLKHYCYPCCLVRIIKKPKRTSVRKSLAAQMSISKFRCGRTKIVTLKNLTKYEKFFNYLHIYNLK